jgi:acyl-CoA thioesterase YciA
MSITVDVMVYAQRRPDKDECVKVTEVVLTYVAVDNQRRPRVVSAQHNSCRARGIQLP